MVWCLDGASRGPAHPPASSTGIQCHAGGLLLVLRGRSRLRHLEIPATRPKSYLEVTSHHFVVPATRAATAQAEVSRYDGLVGRVCAGPSLKYVVHLATRGGGGIRNHRVAVSRLIFLRVEVGIEAQNAGRS